MKGAAPLAGARVFLSVAASILLMAPAPALAEHNTPVQARKTAVPFVTSYLPCEGGSLTDPASGTTNACPAVRRNPAFSFAGKGQLAGNLTVVSPGEPVLPSEYVVPGTVGPDARIYFEGTHVLKHDLPYNGNLFMLNRPRFTDDGCATSCTLSDVEGVYPRLATSPPVCKAGRCFEVLSANNTLGSLLPGIEPPISGGLRSNGQERGVCISAALPIPNAFQNVFACHGFALGRATHKLPAYFDYPRPSGASRTDNVMVRSYKRAIPGLGCISVTHRPPLDVPGFLSACAAVPDSMKLDFGPAGRGYIKMRASRNPANPRLNALIGATDVRDRSTGQPFSGELSFRVPVRVTHSACRGGEICTLPDKTLSIPVDCEQGRCRGRGDLGADLPPNTVSVLEHTPAPLTAATSPGMPCLYDAPEGQPANEFGCVGIFVP